jgi:hypothetical protein
MISGGITAAIALACMVLYPQFQSPTPQHKTMVLRKRYWLYYALQFMAGARRQVFMVFAGFMMVERFGFDVHELTALYLINLGDEYGHWTGVRPRCGALWGTQYIDF